MLRFLLLVVLSGLSTTATLWGQAQDLGQEAVRELWHDEKVDVLQSQHFFKDVSEAYWASKLQGEPLDRRFLDPRVSLDQSLTFLFDRPYDLGTWFPPVLQYLKSLGTKPFSSLPALEHIFYLVVPPLFLVLFGIFWLRLWILSPALVPLLPQVFAPYGTFVLAVLFFAVVFWIVYFNLYAIGLVIVASTAAVFSRRARGPIILGVIVSFLISMSILWEPLKNTLLESEIRQELREGRTRIEYSSSFLDRLSPMEKATLSYYNGDIAEARFWIDEAEASLSRDVLRATLLYTGTNPKAIIRQLEDANKEYGAKPVLKFNLAHLYNQAQELVQSEAMLNQLSKDERATYIQRSSLLDRRLLPYLPPLTLSDLKGRWDEYFLEWRTHLHRSWIDLLKFFSWLILPWLVLGIALYQRRYANGLCHLSGSLTTSPKVDLSPYAKLATSIEDLQKSQRLKQEKRKFDNAVRQYAQIQSQRSLLWSWALPGANYLVYGQPWRCFHRSFWTYFLLWLAIGEYLRVQVLETLGVSYNFYFYGQDIHWIPLVLALVLYAVFVFESRKRAYR